LKIRDFRESDVITLVHISNEAFRDELDRRMSAFTPERFVSFSTRPNARILIAEEIADVAGFVTLTEGDVETPAQIHPVAVRKKFRRRGIGKELMKAALDHVKSTGRRKLKLFTRPWNTTIAKRL